MVVPVVRLWFGQAFSIDRWKYVAKSNRRRVLSAPKMLHGEVAMFQGVRRCVERSGPARFLKWTTGRRDLVDSGIVVRNFLGEMTFAGDSTSALRADALVAAGMASQRSPHAGPLLQGTKSSYLEPGRRFPSSTPPSLSAAVD